MKREVKGSGTVTSPEPMKSVEREFANAIEYMVEQMRTRFRNQAIDALNQSTIEKFATEDSARALEAAGYQFADAQIGNFANVFLGLAEKVRRKLLKQFDDKRLEKLAKQYTGKVNRRNQEEFYRRVQKRIGISKEELEATEGLTFQINAYQLETYQWLRKMRDDTMQQWTSQTLRLMAEGKGLPEILSQFDDMVEKRKGHAKMVARTQISTFNSLVTKARARNLGIERAVWVSSRDERTRPSHASRDGKEFDLAEGLYDSRDGETLLPGATYNCFPGSVKINHSSLCQKLYRRWYSGELTELVRDDGVVLHSTPNHPILTVSGFKPAHAINIGDNVIGTLEQSSNGIELYAKDMIPTFEQLAGAVDLLGVEHAVAASAAGQFHGDVSNSDIDVVRIDSLLVGEVNSSIRKKFAKLELTDSDKMIVLSLLTCAGVPGFRGIGPDGSPDRIMSVLNLVRSSLLIHLSPLELFGFALGAWSNPDLEKSLSDDIPGNAEMFSDCVFALSVLVHGLDVIDRKIDFLGAAGASRGLESNLLKLLGESVGINPDLLGRVGAERSVSYKACRVVDKRTVDFSGHIYNLQTVSGDYIADTTAVSNCRCTYRLVIPSAEEEADNG